MANILDKIFAQKKEELETTKRKAPLSEIKNRVANQTPVREICKALTDFPPSRIIAEIKSRTPFKGQLRKNFDPLEIARDYADNGAAALSILTESAYFGGSIDLLVKVNSEVDRPLLRKDFIFSEYQVYESRAFGGDFFLLIATYLDTNHMADLLALGKEIGLPALVETHSEKDMEKAFKAGAEFLGINNRDLTSGKTDLNISRRLIKMGKMESGNILVCESGIHSRKEIDEFEQLGAQAFLIGESLMTAEDIPAKLKAFLGNEKSSAIG